jgi:hypothetical protein
MVRGMLGLTVKQKWRKAIDSLNAKECISLALSPPVMQDKKPGYWEY